jgi:hypothetical protein
MSRKRALLEAQTEQGNENRREKHSLSVGRGKYQPPVLHYKREHQLVFENLMFI